MYQPMVQDYPDPSAAFSCANPGPMKAVHMKPGGPVCWVVNTSLEVISSSTPFRLLTSPTLGPFYSTVWELRRKHHTFLRRLEVAHRTFQKSQWAEGNKVHLAHTRIGHGPILHPPSSVMASGMELPESAVHSSSHLLWYLRTYLRTYPFPAVVGRYDRKGPRRAAGYRPNLTRITETVEGRETECEGQPRGDHLQLCNGPLEGSRASPEICCYYP